MQGEFVSQRRIERKRSGSFVLVLLALALALLTPALEMSAGGSAGWSSRTVYAGEEVTPTPTPTPTPQGPGEGSCQGDSCGG